MYRDQAQAFSLDSLALSLAKDGIEQTMDKELSWVKRVFFYMPFEHAESLSMQERSVELFRDLVNQVPGDEQDMVYGYVNYAIKHYKVIEEFGRFPHRNKILNRESTPEEVEFLKQPGSSF